MPNCVFDWFRMSKFCCNFSIFYRWLVPITASSNFLIPKHGKIASVIYMNLVFLKFAMMGTYNIWKSQMYYSNFDQYTNKVFMEKIKIFPLTETTSLAFYKVINNFIVSFCFKMARIVLNFCTAGSNLFRMGIIISCWKLARHWWCRCWWWWRITQRTSSSNCYLPN